MSTGNGADCDKAVSGARPVTLMRYRPGVTGETTRAIHLVPLPVKNPAEMVNPADMVIADMVIAEMVIALCGAPLRAADIEPVNPGQGMPCTVCVLSHVADNPPPPPAAIGNPRIDTDPLAATAGYREWGWPVTLRRDQISLHLNGDTVTLIIPVLPATEVIEILAQRRCPVSVLAHPYAPEHRILLVAEPFGVALPWPPGVHQVIGTLLLPPTTTPRGPITWVQLPEPNALRLCREIDVLAALRTALNDPPAPH